MIGIVGAAGAVGHAAVAALARAGHRDLRLGGRRREALDALAATVPTARVATVDLWDAAGLANFCRDCQVVLNCAGPAREVGDRVARAALGMEVDYVDAAGDDALRDQVARILRVPPGRTAVISAGLMPGLTGLLPRYLAQLTPGTRRALIGYVGGRDRFTATAAADFLAGGASFGSARVRLRGGARVPDTPAAHPPAPAGAATPPFFPEPASTLAFLSTEVERVCARLGIPDANWYSVFPGAHVSAALRAPAADGTAEALVHASALDTFGRPAYQLIVLELVTSRTTKTLSLRGSSASALTGEFAAMTVDAVVRGALPPGVHHAGEALAPGPAIACLRSAPGIDEIALVDGSANDTGRYVEEVV